MNSFVRTAIVAVVAAVAGAAASTGWRHYMDGRSKDQQAELESKIRDHLSDPASAQFRGVKRVAHSQAICGEVNAKNKMGGYVGFTSFVLLSDGRMHFDPGDGPQYGSTTDKLEAAQKSLAFLDVHIANCEPPSAAAKASAP